MRGENRACEGMGYHVALPTCTTRETIEHEGGEHLVNAKGSPDTKVFWLVSNVLSFAHHNRIYEKPNSFPDG